MQVRDRFDELAARGVAVLVVGFAPAPSAERYRAVLELPFAVATDPARRAYAAYGVLEGPAWQVWHPRVLWRYLVLLLRGMKLQRPPPGENLAQLGGDFVIGPDGVVLFAHVSRRPDDRPDVSQVIAALARPRSFEP